MKLFYIDPHPVPDTTPSTLQMLQMVDALAQAGAEVTLITPQPKLQAEAILGRPLAAKTHYFSDWRHRWFFPSSSHKPFYWRVSRWLKQHRPDAVFVRNLKLADVLLKACPDIPLFFETHELFAQSFREEHPERNRRQEQKLAALIAREQRVYRQARGLIGLTGLLLDDIRTAYGPLPATLVAPDGVDETLAAQARHLHPPAGKTRLLYLGSLHRWKGVEIAIRAMPWINNADTELWIAGGSDQRQQELQVLIDSLGLANRVQLLGRVTPVNRFELIAQSHICLLPLINTSIGSRYTSPLKLFEYLAMGKTVVASDLPSLREVIVHQHNGWLVPPEDPQALAAAITTLQQQPQCQQQINQAALNTAGQYSWLARAKRTLQFIEEGRSHAL